jgi:predicted SAM-dependent methyltransferase
MNKLKSALRTLRNLAAAKSVRQCPICDWSGRQFTPSGPPLKRRFDSRCPNCGSMERHRLAYLVAEERVALDCSNVIHVAPEKELSRWLRSKSDNYLSIDLYNEAMARMDLTDLDLEDNSQSLIWASHVLEHIVDDRKAISELYRVLTPRGVAFIQVPIWRMKTLEDLSKCSQQERLESFYQEDHVRLYGLDIMDRFQRIGFSSELHRAQDFGPEVLLRNGLSFASTDEVFVFQK